MLLFKKQFLPAIRAGTKTQTIRCWKTLRYRAGQRSYIPGVGYILITTIDRIRLEELSEADSRADGFNSLVEMLDEVRRIYSGQTGAAQCYRVRFELRPEQTKVTGSVSGKLNAKLPNAAQ